VVPFKGGRSLATNPEAVALMMRGMSTLDTAAGLVT
jgi:hypothetical protein